MEVLVFAFKMSTVDSVATFKARVESLVLGSYWKKFGENGWDTHGTFAFSCMVTPGAMDPTASGIFDTEVVLPLLGDKNHKDKAKLRRLQGPSLRE